MSGLKFFGRLLSVILPVVSFHIMGIELLLYFVMAPTVDEFKLMLIHPLPLATSLVFAYCVIVYFYSRPIRLFLNADGRGEGLDESRLQPVQDRCINLSYFLAALSFPAYIIGGAGGVLIIGPRLGWPQEIFFYGFLAGIIAGLLTIPMSVYASAWAVRPVLERTMALSPDFDAARTAGLKVSLRIKFVMIVIVMVVGITGYAVILGYSQTNAVLKNMEKMEQLLPSSDAAKLVDEIERTSDPRIRSSRYFRSRMGSLKIFFVGLMFVGTVLALIVSIAAAGETTRPLRILRNVAERVREGHYDEPIRFVANDELSELGAVLNRMMETIKGQMRDMESVVENLQGGVRRIDETVNTILEVSADQSSGATQQASVVQEAFSIAEQIVATAKQIAERAKMVDDVAGSTLSACKDGEMKLNQAREEFQGIAQEVESIRGTMKKLDERFQEIYKIMKWMGEMSEQTDILALNASLEAVGAGDRGQRFMVVAQATRRLASRSAEATKEINALVETIQESTMEAKMVAEKGGERVVAGGYAIGEVTEALKNISTFAGSTSMAASEITHSTGQQTTASEQLAGAVSEVLEVAKKVENGAKGIETSIAGLGNFAEKLRMSAKRDEEDAAHTA